MLRNTEGRPGTPQDPSRTLQNHPKPWGGWGGVTLGGQNRHVLAPNKNYLSLKQPQTPNKQAFEVLLFFKNEICLNSHIFVKLQYNFKPAPDTQFSL